jgi:hypothetical protein
MAKALSEEELCKVLIGVVIIQEPEIRAETYFDRQNDPEFRNALAEFLRSARPMPRNMRNALANLFDPAEAAGERYLVFKYRKPGKHQWTGPRDLAIAKSILTDVNSGVPLKAAVADATQKYGLNSSDLYKIWKKHKAVAQALLELRVGHNPK